jgi:hypothetical protein
VSETTAPGAGEPTPPVIDAEPARPVDGSESARSASLGNVSRKERARSAGYRSRFVIIYLCLALVAGVGVGAFVVILTRPDPAPTPKWSAWVPTGSEGAQVKQIADQIAKHYRMKSGQQLVAALPSTPKVTGSGGDVAVSAIAIRPDTSTGKKEEDQIDVVPASHSYQYILCGLGTNCSIKGGAASTARHALLRREALELALYTFKYVHDIDSVSVFLPPRPDGASSATAVFLKRSDVENQLHKPLADAIGSKTPTIGGMSKKELALVNKLTEPRLYSYEYQQAQDGSAVLIYNPVVLGA